MFAAWIPDGDIGKWAGSLPKKIQDEFTDTMTLLRNPVFQQLLMDYPRSKRSFWVTYDTKDEVNSYIMERYGKYNSAEDYLAAFSVFIKENEDQIAAIKILLDRPKDWKPQALDQLRKALQQHSFDEKHLRQAHGTVYRKDLADIISMVKHAADAQAPLLDARERVARAVRQVSAGRTLTVEQQAWLDRIAQHLETNLAIEPEHFDINPILERPGGWGAARRAFGDRALDDILHHLNEAMAA